ncbi:galactose mutarotase-like isoform X2 [Phymastichus coffea]|nr:galactose mutarotase-like isoform X2 [Phymastichus coffea]XP_058799029.1 galactose mutarotase-like isoform X2 [Phymastichus coffea]XP_058799030.1 galactose mutarotase-like isoform X2 [Phymastichus coffea]
MDPTRASQISVQSWGQVDGKEVKIFTLRNSKTQEVDIISYGATITAIRTPDKAGKIDDVVCGFDNIEGYLSKVNPYFGATVGRVANRIGKGQFKIDGTQYQVSRNIGNNSLHGGLKGWNSKIWETSIENDTVIMTLLSKDGDEGFPGDVLASASFQLTDDGKLIIEMKSTSTKATPINLTNHSYFNLAGHGTNAAEIYKHQITMSADRWTVTDAESIPTGEILPVDNSIMDLRKPTILGDVINKVPGGGFDYNFCLPGCLHPDQEKFVAKVIHPNSGRTLEVLTNQPGVQLYTANFFPAVGADPIVGKQGKQYFKHGAFCLETQNYPDAVNHENFPNSILRPHHLYYHIVTYKFGVQA